MRWFRWIVMGIMLVTSLSACALFKHASEKTEVATPFPSLPASTGVENGSVDATAPSSAGVLPETAYPGPMSDLQGQGSQGYNPYPAPALAASQGSAYPAPAFTAPQSSAYPAPAGEFQATSTMNIQGTPNYSTATPGLATPMPTNFVSPAGSKTPSPTSSMTGTPTSTSTATPGIVRTGIVATDPSTVKLASGRPQLVEFFAYWCTLCKSMAPVMNGLETKYVDRVNFIYLNVDDQNTDPFKQALGYTLIARPHFYLLDGQGKIQNEWIGYVPIEELDAVLKSIAGG